MIGLDYNAIVAQITQHTAGAFQYVAFSATPQQIHWLSANPVYPAAFVSPGQKVIGPNQVKSGGDLRQTVTEEFSVCVLFANLGDMLAQQAATLVPYYRETLRAALVNWHPLPFARTVHPVTEGADDLFLFDGGARTGWLFNYAQEYQIVTPDCWTPAAVANAVGGVTLTTTEHTPQY